MLNYPKGMHPVHRDRLGRSASFLFCACLKNQAKSEEEQGRLFGADRGKRARQPGGGGGFEDLGSK